MSEIISKELFIEVMGNGFDNIKCILKDSDESYKICDEELGESEVLIVFDSIGYSSYMKMDIYKIAHKCKLKALDYGYEIVEYKDKIKIHDLNSINIDVIKSLDQNTINFEPYRVFKAFQWVLDNKE